MVPAQEQEPEILRRPRRWVWWLIALCIPLAIGARIALPWWRHSRMIAELERLGIECVLDVKSPDRYWIPWPSLPGLKIPTRPPGLFALECSREITPADQTAKAIQMAQPILKMLVLSNYEVRPLFADIPTNEMHATSLMCNACELDRASLEHMAHWRHLKLLHLHNCRFTETDLEALRGNASIDQVILDACPVTDDCLQVLATMTHFERLAIIRTEISQSAIDQLDADNPRVSFSTQY